MIITICASKGGTGKTTTAVSVAHRLGSTGRGDVLLIDTDPQGHCAIALGMDPEPGIFTWLVAEQFYNARRYTGRVGLELLPGDSKTKTVELVYRAEADPVARLVEQLTAPARDDYDHLVIDTPATGLLQEAAIAAADVLIVPVRLEHLGVDGLNATLGLRGRLNPGARVIVLPAQYDARLSEHKYNLGVLHDSIAVGVTVAAPIPSRVAVAEAVAYGRTVWEHEARGIDEVRTAYAALVGMILGDGG